MNSSEPDVLWTRWLAGVPLSGVDQTKLHALLADETEARERIEDERLHRMLGLLSAGEDSAALTAALQARLERELPGGERAPPRRRDRRWWYALGGALAGAALASAVWTIVGRSVPAGDRERAIVADGQPGAARGRWVVPTARSPAAPIMATVARSEGRVEIIKAGRAGRAEPGTGLHVDEELRTHGRGSLAATEAPDGTRLELAGDTTVRFGSPNGTGGPVVALDEGTLAAHVIPGAGTRPMVFTTPHAEATVIGTRLVLSVNPKRTRIDVLEGRVTLRKLTGGQVVEVKAAAFAIASADTGPASQSPLLGEALFIHGNESRVVNESDDRLIERLQEGGYAVVAKPSAGATAADAAGKALVVISSTTWADNIGAAFRDVTVPLITWEALLLDDLGMTRGTDLGRKTADLTNLVIKGDHPLAARLVGSVRVTHTPEHMTWGRPSPSAARVAALEGDPDKWGIFAYERGALMQGFLAPARRVGFFLYDDTAASLTDAGLALFDAAVKWATAERP